MSEKLPDIFQVKNLTVLANCKHVISNLKPSDDDPYQIIITKGKNLKTNAQNRLYWRHNEEIHHHTGDDKVDIHDHLKRRYLHPLLMAGTTKNSLEYQFNYQVLVESRNVRNDTEKHEKLRRLHRRILSITDASVKQMSQYIEDYWPYIAGRGIQLTDPDTFYREQGL